jgi:hypothetical protein
LLRMKWWKHIVCGVGRSGILLSQLARHASKDVRVGRICTTKRVPYRSQLIAHQLILFLGPSAVFSIWSQACDLSTRNLMRSSEISYVFNCCNVSGPCCSTFEQLLTFGKDLPLARLAARRVGKDVVQLVKEAFHLASSLPLSHLVTDTKLRRPAVIAATGCKRGCIVCTLQARDASMLHRVVMGGCYIYRLLACM